MATATGLAQYLETRVLDHMFGGPDYTRIATVHLAVFSVTPNRDGTGGTEAAGNGYARLAVTNNATNFPAATVVSDIGRKANGTILTWATATGNWLGGSNIVSVGVFDASVAGNFMAIAILSVAKPDMTNGDIFTAPIGNLVFTLN